MERSDWVIQKFGGSSLADADCFERVLKLVEREDGPRLGVVLSACRGVTDELISLVNLAESQDVSYDARLNELSGQHATIARILLAPSSAATYLDELDNDAKNISRILHTVKIIRDAAQNIRELISGFGEIWSTRLFVELLKSRTRRSGDIRWVDSRRIVTVEWRALGPAVDWGASQRRFDEEIEADFAGRLIIPGFIASDTRGIQTTLGRNGSDFSASIFGALTKAREIQIWTDVDGVLSADPRLVPDAKVIDAMSYNEAMELAYFGAKVIHPQTMAPAVTSHIPIYIRNTFAPEKAGTLICDQPNSNLVVKGITSIDRISLLNLEGAGMIGVPGTAHRLFGALRDENISVILISQGSSEHSICCAIPEDQARRAEDVVRKTFDSELRQGQIQRVEVCRDSSILAVVGDGMAGTHGIAARVFGALAEAGVNIRAIAQGASERNISVVVDSRDSRRGLQAVHAGFYLSPHTVSIGFIGAGTVGSVLIDQLAGETDRLRTDFNLDLRVRGILTSRRMLLASSAIDLGCWRDQIANAAVPGDLDRFIAHVSTSGLPHTVIIDCTASAAIGERYRDWLTAGIHIVTPNKKANSAEFSSYRALKDASRKTGAHYLYEATVGAGLPIITTLRDLRETGDRIRTVDGLLSGTLAYLFNVFNSQEPFSQLVRTAKSKGYTEPDPRDDLSGVDVARKLVILAREIRLPLELKDVRIESLVPSALETCSVDEFLNRLPEYDEAMLARYQAAQAKGKVLRYVGQFDSSGSASVGLVELHRTHPFANIALTDNVVRFVTDRYCDNPLVVQGPGAGPEVTAAGVFADLLRVCAYLGAKL